MNIALAKLSAILQSVNFKAFPYRKQRSEVYLTQYYLQIKKLLLQIFFLLRISQSKSREKNEVRISSTLLNSVFFVYVAGTYNCNNNRNTLWCRHDVALYT